MSKYIEDLKYKISPIYTLSLDFRSVEPDTKIRDDLLNYWKKYDVHIEWNYSPLRQPCSISINQHPVQISHIPIDVRKGAIQIICCDQLYVDQQPMSLHIFGNHDPTIPILLQNTIFIVKPSPITLGKALAQLVIGWVENPCVTSSVYRIPVIQNERGLFLTENQELLAKDRIVFELQELPQPETGRILWVFANPYIETLTGPYGLEILNGIARQHGFKTRITNPFVEYLNPGEGLQKLINQFQPDLIGISLRNIDDALIVHTVDGNPKTVDTQDLLQDVKELLSHIQTFSGPVILGGAAFGASPEVFLDYFGLKYGVIGTADVTIDQLCHSWKPHESADNSYDSFISIWKTLPSTVWKEGEEYWRNPAVKGRVLEQKPDIQRLLPYVLINRKDFRPEAVRGAQGCALGCSYCIESVNRKQMSWRSVEQVVDEMIFAMNHYHIQHFHLTDSEANIPFSRLTDLAEEILRRKLEGKVIWSAYLNVRPFDPSAVPLLTASGLYRYKFAIDHFDDSVLKSYHKNFREKEIIDLLEGMTPFLGEIQVYAGILFGGPGETKKTLTYCIDRVKQYAERGFEFYYNTGVRVYPGTPFAEQWERNPHSPEYYGPGKEDQGISPLVYSTPLPPRTLARYVKEQFSDYPNVAQMNHDKSSSLGYEGYRRFLVAWHAWLDGRIKEAIQILDETENIYTFRQACVLRRLLRLQ